MRGHVSPLDAGRNRRIRRGFFRLRGRCGAGTAGADRGLEMPLYSRCGGAASSWRDAGRAFFTAAGTDRAKSRAAGREAFSLEPAVVERVLLWPAPGRWAMGRDHWSRRSGEVRGSWRKAASRVRDAEGRLAGHGAGPTHVVEAPRHRTNA